MHGQLHWKAHHVLQHSFELLLYNLAALHCTELAMPSLQLLCRKALQPVYTSAYMHCVCIHAHSISVQCSLHQDNHATVVLVNNNVQVTRVPDAPATLDQLDCMCHPVTLCYRLPLQTSPVRTAAQVGQHLMCCIIAAQLGVQALQSRAAHTTKLDDFPPVMHVHSMNALCSHQSSCSFVQQPFGRYVLCIFLSPLGALHACSAMESSET